MFPRGAMIANYANYPCGSMPDSLAQHGSLFRKKRPFLGFNALPAENGTAEDQFPDKSSTRPSTSSKERRRDSSLSSLTDLRSTLRRSSVSLRSRTPRSPSVDNLAVSQSPDKRSVSTTSLRPIITTFPHQQKSSESINRIEVKARRPSVPTGADSRTLTLHHGLKSEENQNQKHHAHSQSSIGGDSHGPTIAGGYLSGSHNPAAVFQHLQDTASKRISTLDYLRKAYVPVDIAKKVASLNERFGDRHEGRVYWFNTLLFNKSELSKLPYFEPRKLARRATNYLLLGISIPAILDPNSNTPNEYLRAFNSLLSEFETYQSTHSPDGPSSSSLSRARIPQMFKRAAHATAPKGRRVSSADALSPQNSNEHQDNRSISMVQRSTPASATFTSFPGNDPELLHKEEYNFLLTPSLPFDPDYFETFSTLCDVLIDCYTKIMGLVTSPETSGPGVGELFLKADAKVRKILMAGVVRDFDEASKQGIKAEVAGLGKIVLGGLM